jgi:hypothetical protein
MTPSTFYIVRSKWADLDFIHEIDLSIADLSSVVRHIAQGEYLPPRSPTGTIEAIYACTPSLGAMRDVTTHVLMSVARRCEEENGEPSAALADLFEKHGITVELPDWNDDEHRLTFHDVMGARA